MRYRLKSCSRFWKKRKLIQVLAVLVLAAIVILGISVYNSLVSDAASESLKYAWITQTNQYMSRSVDDFFKKNPTFSTDLIASCLYEGTEQACYPDAELLDRAERSICATLIGYLTKNDVVSVKIPIGTLTKNKYLSGRGFKVRVNGYTVPAVSSDIEWKVETGGINQTMYVCELQIKVECRLLFAGVEENVSCTTKKPLFTKIIVGEVPFGSG